MSNSNQPLRPATALLLSASALAGAFAAAPVGAHMMIPPPSAFTSGADDPLLRQHGQDDMLAPFAMEDGSISLGADDGGVIGGGGTGGGDSTGGGGGDGGDGEGGDGGDGGDGEGGDGGDGEGGEMEPPPPEVRDGSDRSTPVGAGAAVAAAAIALQEAPDTCGLYNIAERVDCLRDQYRQIAKKLPSSRDYAEMKAAINDAVAQLDTIVKANIDPAVRPVRKIARTPKGDRASATPIRRIAAARVATANAQSAAVLDALSTRLLRSASAGGAQQVRYERAAQAVAGATVLLRST